VPITVIKRDEKRESFDRSKLLRGIVRACEKTGLSATQLEVLIDELEAELQQRAVREVTSQEIGDLVLQHLRPLSEVAYVRFASVYRQFQGILDFVETLNHLREGHPPDSASANQAPHNHNSEEFLASTQQELIELTEPIQTSNHHTIGLGRVE
jgi:transcriptional repressor NrdR